MFDVKSIQGEEYYKMEDCDVCYGNGEIACEECGGEGEMECSDCNGSGNLNCDECGGEGEVDGEECHYCGGDGEVHCGDCGGSGQVHCDECYGDGKVRCEECDGEGEVESSTEVVDVEMSTIVTQNPKLMEELDSLHDPNDDEIKEFGQFIEKYSNEILVIDVINDTEEFDYEWGGDSSVRDKLERTWTNFKNYKVSRNRSKGKNEITALK
jgi:RecJ-like exonuclease